MGILRRLAPAAALAACLGCARSLEDVQRDYARTLRPAAVSAAPVAAAGGTRPRQARPLRIRAWASADYQAQTVRWRDRIAEQIARANEVVEAQFGVRLELVAVGSWSEAPRGAELRATLAAAAAFDPGEDVDWVVAFAGATTLLDTTHDAIGMALLGERHFVVRGMDLLRETRELDAALDRLRVEEREALHRQRKVHREVAVFLHEWAHTLGAQHEGAGVMAARYDASHAGFARGSLLEVMRGLHARHAFEPASWDAWTREVDAELRATRGRAQAAEPARAAPASSHDAWIREAGERVARRDRAGALRALAEAEAAIGAAAVAPDAWARIAGLYLSLETCSAAEAAARRAPGPEADSVLADCAKLRRWSALPAAGVLPREREHAYVAAMRAAQDELAAGRVERGRAAAKELARDFPGTPGPALLECLARAHGAPAVRAKAACAAAAKAAPDAFYPQYVLGAAALDEGRPAEARARLRRAVELDDGVEDAWRRLAVAEERAGGAKAVAELRARYRARFGRELPAR